MEETQSDQGMTATSVADTAAWPKIASLPHMGCCSKFNSASDIRLRVAVATGDIEARDVAAAGQSQEVAGLAGLIEKASSGSAKERCVIGQDAQSLFLYDGKVMMLR